MDSIKQKTITLLRWSEKYTKTDMVYLFHGGFWLGVAHIIASSCGFILTVVLANYLPPEEFGEYRFLLAGFMILSIFTLPGIQTALLQSTPRGYGGNIKRAFWIQVKYGLIGSVIAFFIAGHYLLSSNFNLAIGFMIIGLALPLFNASSSYIFHLQALKNFKPIATYTMIARLSMLFISLLSLLLFPNYAWIIFAAFLLGQIIPNSIFHIKTVKETARGSTDPDLNNYALHFTIIAALGLFALQIDKFFIWNIMGADEVAFFFIAIAIPLEITRLLHLISTLAFPRFSTGNPQDILDVLMPKIFKFLLFTILIVLTYIIFAPLLFSLIFPHYLSSVLYSQIFAISILATAFFPIEIFLRAQKKTKLLYISSIISPSVYIILALVLVISFGIWGIIVAALIEALVRTLLLCYFFTILKKPKVAIYES